MQINSLYMCFETTYKVIQIIATELYTFLNKQQSIHQMYPIEFLLLVVNEYLPSSIPPPLTSGQHKIQRSIWICSGKMEATNYSISFSLFFFLRPEVCFRVYCHMCLNARNIETKHLLSGYSSTSPSVEQENSRK